MSKKLNVLQNVVTKMLDAPVTITANGANTAVTADSTVFALGVHKPYLAVKAIFPFVKAGNNTVAVRLQFWSDTTGGVESGGAYQAVAPYQPLTAALCVDAGHGYIAATGNGVAEATLDLDNVLVGQNLRVRVNATFTRADTDTVIGPILLQLYDAREEPPVNTAMLTTL